MNNNCFQTTIEGLKESMAIQNISKYRKELMGIAIIGVMVNHWMHWVSISEGIAFLILSKIDNWIFTPGLLLLSGFGLYYSLSKNSDILSFYKRRLNRLYLPFVILSIPLYLYFVFVRDDYSFLKFISQITTIDFWINGNYGGMWYVAVSLVLYLLFPFFYKLLFGCNTKKHVVYRFIGLTVLFYFIILLLRFLANSYYNTIEIGLSKMPYFVFGIFAGYLSKNDLLKGRKFVISLIIVSIVFPITYIVKDEAYVLSLLCGVFQKLFYISVITIMLNQRVIQKYFRVFYIILGWFGTYSLELYLLHLHFYRFFEYSGISFISLHSLAGLSVLLAIFLCVPVHLFIEKLIK